MPHFYKYIYFRLYQWNLGWKDSTANGDPDLARYAAQAQLFALIMFNLWALLELVDILTGSKYSVSLSSFLVQYHDGAKRVEALVVGFIVLILIGSYKPYWARIVKDMERLRETRNQRIWRTVGLWIFAIASVVAWYELALASAHSQ